LSLGQVVRRERLRLGMTRLSREGVSRIELGKIAATIRAIDRLGAALDLKPHQLLKAAEDLDGSF
jgi:transcriptional regulator with XRE-family HTH domain